MAAYVDPVVSDAAIREAHGEPLEAAEAVGLLVDDLWGAPFSGILGTMIGLPADPVANAIWEVRDKYRRYLPKAAAEAKFLRDLLDCLLAFTDRWVEERGRSGRGDA